jgi:hypothetical protein
MLFFSKTHLIFYIEFFLFEAVNSKSTLVDNVSQLYPCNFTSMSKKIWDRPDKSAETTLI